MQSTKVDQTPGDMRQTEKLPRGEKAEHTREVWDSSTTSVYGTSNQEDWEEGQGPKEPSYTEEELSNKQDELADKIAGILDEDFPDVVWAFEGEDLTYEEVMAHLGSAVEKAQEEDPAYAEKVEKITPAIQDWSDLCETFRVQVSYGHPIEMIRRVFSDYKEEELPEEEEEVPDLVDELSSQQEELPYEEEDLSYKEEKKHYLLEELASQQEELSAEDVEDIKDGLDYLQLVLGLSYGPDQTYYVDEVLEALQRCVVPGLNLTAMCTHYGVKEPTAIPLDEFRRDFPDLKEDMLDLLEGLSDKEDMLDEEEMPYLMKEAASNRGELSAERVEWMQGAALHILELAVEWYDKMGDQGLAHKQLLNAIQNCAKARMDLPPLFTRYEVTGPEDIPLEQLRTELADLKRNPPYLMEKLSEGEEELPYKEEKMPDLMEELSSKREELPYEEEEMSYKEIAELTGKKTGTVGWLISQGLKALSQDLSELLPAVAGGDSNTPDIAGGSAR